MNKEEPDKTCVERCLQGDVDAFGTLIDRYQRPVFNAILHMVGSYEDARDLCQQVFMKTFEHLSAYDPDRRFFSWIYRVAMNESINHLKSRRHYEPLSPDLEHPYPGPAEAMEARESRQALRAAIQKLDQHYRSVIVLRHFLNLSYSELADVLNLPEKTIKSRLFTARLLLREALGASIR